jgi:hypothetical protein
MDTLLQDFHYALRVLLKAPGLGVAAIMVLRTGAVDRHRERGEPPAGACDRAAEGDWDSSRTRIFARTHHSPASH